MDLLHALDAERLKIKRTLALLLAPLAPLVIVVMQVAIVLERADIYRQEQVPDPWVAYTEQTMFLWAIMLLPLFITLETALLANLEHGNQQWRHLFALPISRAAVYAAKQVSALLIIGLSMAAMVVYIVLSGLALRPLVPGVGLEAPVPWLAIVRYAGLAYLASWLILSLHTWVALRWHSFVVASATGIVVMVVSVVIFQSDWAQWYPWTLPGIAVYSLGEGQTPWATLGLGCLGGLAVALLAGWDLSRRDVL